MLKQE
jgi:hypothetical protein